MFLFGIGQVFPQAYESVSATQALRALVRIGDRSVARQLMTWLRKSWIQIAVRGNDTKIRSKPQTPNCKPQYTAYSEYTNMQYMANMILSIWRTRGPSRRPYTHTASMGVRTRCRAVVMTWLRKSCIQIAVLGNDTKIRSDR